MKTGIKIAIVLILLVIHLSLLICTGTSCWNDFISVQKGHPIYQFMIMLYFKAGINIMTLQQIAKVLVVFEAVILLNYTFKFLCSCILWTLQIILMGAALQLCIFLSKYNDVETSLSSFKEWILKNFGWIIEKLAETNAEL